MKMEDHLNTFSVPLISNKDEIETSLENGNKNQRLNLHNQHQDTKLYLGGRATQTVRSFSKRNVTFYHNLAN